ncbi:MAG: Type IV secretion protein Rhs [uncultured Thiotrichaceae bacterium]|uniref:Type IV secretion protein Rhs n=1 Tax=uncultured Thiotrichaceae bacterium TaxID=298394 RepID=A0A6S6SMU6_9GAMM|nr:MAG: Type IV secretion protein Rhs [uncultured Thiotrichaceae bacterium]
MNINNPRRTLADIDISINHASLPTDRLANLLSVRINQYLSCAAQCEIILHNQIGLALDEISLKTGQSLAVSIEGDRSSLFMGTITAIDYVYGASGEELLHIRGHDAVQTLSMRQHVRAHVKTDIKALAKEWASDIGLRFHTDESPPAWDWKIQYQQADWAWLSALAHTQGYYFQVHEDTLYLFTLKGVGAPLLIDKDEEVREARFTQNSQYHCPSVQTTGWNTTALQQTTGKVGTGLSDEAQRSLIDYPVTSTAQAENTSQAVLERCKTGEKQFWGVVEGSSQYYPGRKLTTQGFSPSLKSNYLLTRVLHCIDAEHGYISELSTAPPELGSLSQGTIKTAIGIVSNVDDPEHAGRIKVSLPTYQDVETDWLHVVQVAAGKKKGLLALPSCGDSVVLLPLSDDPSHAVVLGGLYGMDDLPDTKSVSGDIINRYAFLTPKGQYLRFDEKNNSVTLRNASGSKIQFTPTQTIIHSATDLTIQAPKNNIVIQGNTIDFIRG